MDHMLYIATNAAKQTMLAQAVNANNLANVSTTGFRAELAAQMTRPLHGTGFPSRAFSETRISGSDFSTGSLIETGNELDVAINGKGWFTVQMPDGSEAYTRAGNLRISEIGGILTTASGHPVLGNGGAVAIPQAEKIEIGADGTISIRAVGQEASTLVTVDRLKLVNPPEDQLVRGTDGLMRMASGEVLVPDTSVTVTSGVTETSNVNAVDAMVNMISLAREFEVQVKAMKTAEEIDAASARLLQFS